MKDCQWKVLAGFNVWTFDNFLKNVAVNNCTFVGWNPYASFFVFTYVPKELFLSGTHVLFFLK
jgi:hypothetical protein